MIWIVFAVMTAAVLVAVLWPVMKARPPEAADRNAFDRAVFRDQLAELDRDLARGAIGEKEAEAARNEISRRLIAAADAAPAPLRRLSPALAFAAALAVPAVAMPLYLHTGSPNLPDVPLAQRLDNAEESGDYEALMAKVERHLAENPDDVQGWRVLAPAYQRVQRYGDAAKAFANILRLAPPTAETLADYAEMLTFANEGIVSADAHRAVEQALALDPGLPKARYFDGLALKQEGKAAEARTAFEAFLADTPADAPWRPMLEAELRDLGARPPALDQDTVAAVSGLPADEQQQMIRGMVEGLDQRLQQDGSDLEGWLRLIRARVVLQEAAKASAAYQSARTNFKDNPEALAALETLAKELNVQ